MMNLDKFKKTMTPLERDLIFAVMDDHEPALMPIYLMRRVCKVGEGLDFIKILHWLYKNKITGKVFTHWFLEKEGAVNALAHARKSVLKDIEARKIIARRRM